MEKKHLVIGAIAIAISAVVGFIVWKNMKAKVENVELDKKLMEEELAKVSAQKAKTPINVKNIVNPDVLRWQAGEKLYAKGDTSRGFLKALKKWENYKKDEYIGTFQDFIPDPKELKTVWVLYVTAKGRFAQINLNYVKK